MHDNFKVLLEYVCCFICIPILLLSEIFKYQAESRNFDANSTVECTFFNI